MPLFYFDTRDGGSTFRDETGLDLPDWETARQEAINALPDIARDVLPADGDRREIVADVRDASGRVVFTAHLSFMARRVS